jgi:hypothetical protein
VRETCAWCWSDTAVTWPLSLLATWQAVAQCLCDTQRALGPMIVMATHSQIVPCLSWANRY